MRYLEVLHRGIDEHQIIINSRLLSTTNFRVLREDPIIINSVESLFQVNKKQKVNRPLSKLQLGSKFK